jgi:hypothetical protein
MHRPMARGSGSFAAWLDERQQEVSEDNSQEGKYRVIRKEFK